MSSPRRCPLPRPFALRAAASVVAAVCLAVGPADLGARISAAVASATAVGVASNGSGGGWEAFSDGTVTAFGGAAGYGDLSGVGLHAPLVGIAATPDGHGYWLVASDGGIFSFGDAAFYGSTGNIHLNRPVVGMAPTPDGHGYWLVASDGGIFSFGDAAFYGSTGNIHLNRPVVGMAPTPDGHGYWLVASDGGIFSFGDAAFYGSTGNIHLNQPVIGMASTAGGGGYWLVARDGGVFTFGDAPFDGAIGSGASTAGLAPLPHGAGYLLVSVAGAVTRFAVGPSGTPGPPSPVTGGDPLAGIRFYVPDGSASSAAAAAARSGQTTTAALLDKIATHENAVWLNDPNSDVTATVSSTLDAAATTGSVPVFVLYAIPDRDCGGYSSGGAADAAAYHAYAEAVAAGTAGRQAVFIVEPDALADESGCLDAAGQAAREAMIADAVNVISATDGRAAIYIDAGHAGWQTPATMAGRLEAAGVAGARGFSLNVSNFDTTASEEAYGDAISASTAGTHFVVDTSRNGAGPAPGAAWCNPPGMALGSPATASSGDPHADALLWVKVPGESDGTCNGGPAAGTFWTDYAVGLASRASW